MAFVEGIGSGGCLGLDLSWVSVRVAVRLAGSGGVYSCSQARGFRGIRESTGDINRIQSGGSGGLAQLVRSPWFRGTLNRL
jgi:hypothetical protein